MTTALPVEKLLRRADLSAIAFDSTDELAPLDGLVGQPRVADALKLGTRIDAPGFNLFVIGSPGASIDRAVKHMLAEKAATEPLPPDRVYVNNFADPRAPSAIELPPGRGLIVAAASAFAGEEDAARLAALRRAPVIVVPDSSRA